MNSRSLISLEEINREAFRIWEKYFSPDAAVRVPLTYPPLCPGALLFMGLNPSFTSRGYASFLKGTRFVNFDPDSFFAWKNRDSFDFSTAREIEEFSKANYSYFNKFKQMAQRLNVQWEHIDLFLIRETNQKKVLPQIYTKSGRLNEFARDQILLAQKIISKIQPKALVVANALASKIVFETFHLTFDPELGCHRYEANRRQIPVFLTSMLTGQRALDNFSFQRLEWHVGQVLTRVP